MITLTNGVQIPENAVQLQTTAAIDGYYVTQPLRLVQYDETLPVAAVQLTYQNQPYTPPTGAELNVRMGKPDGTTVYNPCLGMDSSGIVYFAFTQQMTIVAGTGTLTVEITDSGVKNSAPIIAEIRPNPVPEGSIESADEFLTLQEILTEAKKWGQIVQANASNIQQVVDNLEDIQNAAENAQAAAESAAAAQQAAQEALGFRTFFSAVTPDANGNLDPSRPMTVGPAASVEIESAGDRIQSVTALGFTQQAGTGDPSPTNVRAIANGGVVLASYVLDGSADETYETGSNKSFVFRAFPRNTSNAVFQTGAYSSALKPTSAETLAYGSSPGVAFSDTNGLLLRFAGITTQDALKAALQANPLTVWYPTTDGTGSLYAPIILTSGEYRATCLELTAPLCEGDSVVSWVKSGCDKMVVLKGDPSENWGALSNQNYTRLMANGITTAQNGQVWCNKLSYASGSNYVTVGSGNSRPSVFLDKTKYTSVEDWTNELARAYSNGDPYILFYQSTNYTEAADIPVSLETHVQSVLVLDGDFGWTWNLNSGAVLYRGYIKAPQLKTSGDIVCSVAKAGETPTAPNTIQVAGGNLLLNLGGYNGADDFDAFKAYLSGNPATVVAELATPITYAHEAVVLEAATGEQLTYTVTGQSGGTVSVTLKPFQDGGHAAMAGNAQQLDGLTLLAIKESMTPVGYIFSWAPVGDGPDLSTPAKVAAYFGFGTWAAYGTGQVLVGVDSGQTEFATVGQTGGEKTHTLTTAELAKHSHKMYWSNEGGTGSAYGALIRDALSGGPWPYSYFTETDGGGQPHNNLQPYVVVYRWQRVA